jgi:thiamine-phosphate pyrophosphorylase
MSARALPPRLVALSPGDLAERDVPRFLRAVESALEAGLRGILLREPGLEDRPLLAAARALRASLPADAYFVLHDRVHLVEAAGAHAVHLGFRSLAPGVARELVADEIALGFSAHAGDAQDAWAGADYLFFGPVLDTPSKRGLQAPVGFDGLRRAVERAQLPVWAIGGLRPEHAAPALAHGAAGIAVLGGILRSADVPAALHAYARALATA